MSYQQHCLKTVQPYYNFVCEGIKKAECRRDDRNFKVNDTLILQEYHPKTGLSGREIKFKITHILRGEEYGVIDGFAVLSIEKLPEKHFPYAQ